MRRMGVMRRTRISGVSASILVLATVMSACGGAGTPAAASAAATSAATAPGAGATGAAAASAAVSTATGTLNVTLTGGITGTMTEVKSVPQCSNTAVGFALNIQSSLGGAPFSFGVALIGNAYKGPGSYTLSSSLGTVVVAGATIRDRWEAANGGTVTVAADGSGTVDADLRNGANPAPAHVKGTFSCKR
jgi:hypothetical protein